MILLQSWFSKICNRHGTPSGNLRLFWVTFPLFLSALLLPTRSANCQFGFIAEYGGGPNTTVRQANTGGSTGPTANYFPQAGLPGQVLTPVLRLTLVSQAVGDFIPQLALASLTIQFTDTRAKDIGAIALARERGAGSIPVRQRFMDPSPGEPHYNGTTGGETVDPDIMGARRGTDQIADIVAEYSPDEDTLFAYVPMAQLLNDPVHPLNPYDTNFTVTFNLFPAADDSQVACQIAGQEGTTLNRAYSGPPQTPSDVIFGSDPFPDPQLFSNSLFISSGATDAIPDILYVLVAPSLAWEHNTTIRPNFPFGGFLPSFTGGTFFQNQQDAFVTLRGGRQSFIGPTGDVLVQDGITFVVTNLDCEPVVEGLPACTIDPDAIVGALDNHFALTPQLVDTDAEIVALDNIADQVPNRKINNINHRHTGGAEISIPNTGMTQPRDNRVWTEFPPEAQPRFNRVWSQFPPGYPPVSMSSRLPTNASDYVILPGRFHPDSGIVSGPYPSPEVQASGADNAWFSFDLGGGWAGGYAHRISELMIEVQGLGTLREFPGDGVDNDLDGMTDEGGVEDTPQDLQLPGRNDDFDFFAELRARNPHTGRIRSATSRVAFTLDEAGEVVDLSAQDVLDMGVAAANPSAVHRTQANLTEAEVRLVGEINRLYEEGRGLGEIINGLEGFFIPGQERKPEFRQVSGLRLGFYNVGWDPVFDVLHVMDDKNVETEFRKPPKYYRDIVTPGYDPERKGNGLTDALQPELRILLNDLAEKNPARAAYMVSLLRIGAIQSRRLDEDGDGELNSATDVFGFAVHDDIDNDQDSDDWQDDSDRVLRNSHPDPGEIPVIEDPEDPVNGDDDNNNSTDYVDLDLQNVPNDFLLGALCRYPTGPDRNNFPVPGPEDLNIRRNFGVSFDCDLLSYPNPSIRQLPNGQYIAIKDGIDSDFDSDDFSDINNNLTPDIGEPGVCDPRVNPELCQFSLGFTTTFFSPLINANIPQTTDFGDTGVDRDGNGVIEPPVLGTFPTLAGCGVDPANPTGIARCDPSTTDVVPNNNHPDPGVGDPCGLPGCASDPYCFTSPDCDCFVTDEDNPRTEAGVLEDPADPADGLDNNQNSLDFLDTGARDGIPDIQDQFIATLVCNATDPDQFDACLNFLDPTMGPQVFMGPRIDLAPFPDASCPAVALKDNSSLLRINDRFYPFRDGIDWNNNSVDWVDLNNNGKRDPPGKLIFPFLSTPYSGDPGITSNDEFDPIDSLDNDFNSPDFFDENNNGVPDEGEPGTISFYQIEIDPLTLAPTGNFTDCMLTVVVADGLDNNQAAEMLLNQDGDPTNDVALDFDDQNGNGIPEPGEPGVNNAGFIIANGRDDNGNGFVDENIDELIDEGLVFADGLDNNGDGFTDDNIDEDIDAGLIVADGLDNNENTLVDEGIGDNITFIIADGIDNDLDTFTDEFVDEDIDRGLIIANGLDDDQDGLTDEGIDEGIDEEDDNGLDDDGDGLVDEDVNFLPVFMAIDEELNNFFVDAAGGRSNAFDDGSQGPQDFLFIDHNNNGIYDDGRNDNLSPNRDEFQGPGIVSPLTDGDPYVRPIVLPVDDDLDVEGEDGNPLTPRPAFSGANTLYGDAFKNANEDIRDIIFDELANLRLTSGFISRSWLFDDSPGDFGNIQENAVFFPEFAGNSRLDVAEVPGFATSEIPPLRDPAVTPFRNFVDAIFPAPTVFLTEDPDRYFLKYNFNDDEIPGEQFPGRVGPDITHWLDGMYDFHIGSQIPPDMPAGLDYQASIYGNNLTLALDTRSFDIPNAVDPDDFEIQWSPPKFRYPLQPTFRFLDNGQVLRNTEVVTSLFPDTVQFLAPPTFSTTEATGEIKIPARSTRYQVTKRQIAHVEIADMMGFRSPLEVDGGFRGRPFVEARSRPIPIVGINMADSIFNLSERDSQIDSIRINFESVDVVGDGAFDPRIDLKPLTNNLFTDTENDQRIVDSGVGLYVDSKTDGRPGEFDEADTPVLLTLDPRGWNPDGSGDPVARGGGFYVVLRPQSPLGIPNTDFSEIPARPLDEFDPNRGYDFFIVIRTSEFINARDSFRAFIRAGDIRLVNGSNVVGSEFQTHTYTANVPTVLTNDVAEADGDTVRTVPNSNSLPLIGVNVHDANNTYAGTPSRLATVGLFFNNLQGFSPPSDLRPLKPEILRNIPLDPGEDNDGDSRTFALPDGIDNDQDGLTDEGVGNSLDFDLSRFTTLSGVAFFRDMPNSDRNGLFDDPLDPEVTNPDLPVFLSGEEDYIFPSGGSAYVTLALDHDPVSPTAPGKGDPLDPDPFETIPTSDIGQNFGPDYFVVVRTSQSISSGDRFSVELGVFFGSNNTQLPGDNLTVFGVPLGFMPGASTGLGPVFPFRAPYNQSPLNNAKLVPTNNPVAHEPISPGFVRIPLNDARGDTNLPNSTNAADGSKLVQIETPFNMHESYQSITSLPVISTESKSDAPFLVFVDPARGNQITNVDSNVLGSLFTAWNDIDEDSLDAEMTLVYWRPLIDPVFGEILPVFPSDCRFNQGGGCPDQENPSRFNIASGIRRVLFIQETFNDDPDPDEGDPTLRPVLFENIQISDDNLDVDPISGLGGDIFTWDVRDISPGTYRVGAFLNDMDNPAIVAIGGLAVIENVLPVVDILSTTETRDTR